MNPISQTKNFVGGKFVDTGVYFPNLNPRNSQHISDVCEADESLIDCAVSSARTALSGAWAETSVKDRQELLHKIADGIEDRFDEFVAAEIADTGKPLDQVKSLDIPRGAANFRLFADLVAQRHDACFYTELNSGERAINLTITKPAGVVAIISPWNLPMLLTTWKLAPALACGNTVVVKPSEETPSTATLLAEVMRDAGIPNGVYNVVHGFGPDSAGEHLSKNPGIDALTFTGESETGSAIMKSVADGVKSISFELGGKNAAIVFSDADFNQAVNGTVKSSFMNSGQICLSTERVYVERKIYDEFVYALAKKAEKLEIGGETGLGPLISENHRIKVLAYYQLVNEEGGKFEAGGGVPEFQDERDCGFYVEPSVVAGLDQSARCMREEIFGPICCVAPFDTEDEAISLANDSEYGLASVIWTRDLNRAHRVSAKVRAGIIWVNTWYLRDLRTPFGGIGKSGIGREGGQYSLDFYSETSNICIKGD